MKSKPKQNTKINLKVYCIDCFYGGKTKDNGLTSCSNLTRNPKNYKVGTWERECKYFKKS